MTNDMSNGVKNAGIDINLDEKLVEYKKNRYLNKESNLNVELDKKKYKKLISCTYKFCKK